MANSKRKCGFCKERKQADTMYIKGAQAFCSVDHYIECQVSNRNKLAKKGKSVKRKDTKERKEAIKTRTQHYNELQTLVNRFVRLRDKDEPCCTCGTTNPNIKYDAGHMLSRGSHPETRFNLINIHRQCSKRCNVLGSGMRHEYELFMVDKYGQDELDKLKGPHPTLKQQFPNIEDIQREKVKFRKLIKEM
jgi:hypothetical protein